MITFKSFMRLRWSHSWKLKRSVPKKRKTRSNRRLKMLRFSFKPPSPPNILNKNLANPPGKPNILLHDFNTLSFNKSGIFGFAVLATSSYLQVQIYFIYMNFQDRFQGKISVVGRRGLKYTLFKPKQPETSRDNHR